MEVQKQTETKPETVRAQKPIMATSTLKYKSVAPAVSSPKQSKAKSKAKINSNASHSYKVIAGTYTNKTMASNYLKTLKKKGFSGFLRKSRSKTGNQLYQVQLGAYTKKQEAASFKKTLLKSGIDSYILKK